MLFLMNKNSLIFILILMWWSKAEKEIDSFMSLIRSPQGIDCRDNANNRTIEVDIQSRNQLFRLTDLLNGSVKIDFERIPYDHVLLTFANDGTNENAATNEMDCWSTINDSLVVSKLFGNGTQMFCLMEKDAKTVSPLDCLSILTKSGATDSDSDPVWLTEDDKALAVGLLAMGLILCVVVGVVIGIMIVKRRESARKVRKHSVSTRPDLISSDWKSNQSYPYTDSDNISVASDERNDYVAAVNPSPFDLIKLRLEKSENPAARESENQYDLEDMPYSKAPTAPSEPFRDSGISTCGPIYAISTKVQDRNVQSDNNGENLYLCVDHDIVDKDNKKNE